MSRMPRPQTGAPPPSVECLNVVPTRATRQLAERMIFAAAKECGADSVLDNIRELDPKQTAAMIGILLDVIRQRHVGRPIIPLTLRPEQRREAHRLYNLGNREAWVIQGNREYQRAASRSLRARGMTG